MHLFIYFCKNVARQDKIINCCSVLAFLFFLLVIIKLSKSHNICFLKVYFFFRIQDAYSEVASLFAEFFRDLDIVPSDIIAGLVLLRQRQRTKRSAILDQVFFSIRSS